MQICQPRSYFIPDTQDRICNFFEDRYVRDQLAHPVLETTDRDTPDLQPKGFRIARR